MMMPGSSSCHGADVARGCFLSQCTRSYIFDELYRSSDRKIKSEEYYEKAQVTRYGCGKLRKIHEACGARSATRPGRLVVCVRVYYNAANEAGVELLERRSRPRHSSPAPRRSLLSSRSTCGCVQGEDLFDGADHQPGVTAVS
jgi:hypothetical protein